jgi:HSP20 family protein
MTQELQVRDKQEVGTPAEQTRNIPVFIPAVDIFESEQGMTVVADMPGVTTEGLAIDLKDDILTIRGESQPEKEGRTLLYREYVVGNFFRQFTLSEVIDQAKITARLKDGVLTLELPKAEKAKPKKIEVKAE